MLRNCAMKSGIEHAHYRNSVLYFFPSCSNHSQRGSIVQRSQILQTLHLPDYFVRKLSWTVKPIGAMHNTTADGIQIGQRWNRITASSVLLDPGEKQFGCVSMILNPHRRFLQRRSIWPYRKRCMLIPNVIVRAGDENGAETSATVRLHINEFKF